MLVASTFSFFHNIFFHLKDRNLVGHFCYIQNCKFLQFSDIPTIIDWLRIRNTEVTKLNVAHGGKK